MDPTPNKRAKKEPRFGFQTFDSSESGNDDDDDDEVRYQPNSWLKALDACYAPTVQVRICREHARYIAAMLKSEQEVITSRNDSMEMDSD